MIMCSYLRTRSHKPSNNDITRRNATRLLASSWAKSSRKCEMSLYCMVRYTWTEWESVRTLLRVWFCTTFDFSPLEWSSCCPKYNFWVPTTATTVNLLHEHTSAAMLLASVLGPGSWWMHWLAQGQANFHSEQMLELEQTLSRQLRRYISGHPFHWTDHCSSDLLRGRRFIKDQALCCPVSYRKFVPQIEIGGLRCWKCSWSLPNEFILCPSLGR